MKDNENLIFGGVRLISIKCRCGCGLVVYKEKSLGTVLHITLARYMSSIYKLGYLFLIVWLGLTKFSQSAAGRNFWIDSIYPVKYLKYYVETMG